MKKAAWALVGLLVGVLIATAIPVGAHHNDLRMRRRLTRLENQMAVQRQKTQYMDREGFYWGPIIGSQVYGLCAADSPATWTTDGMSDELVWINDCIPTSAQRSTFRQQIDVSP